MVLLLRRVRSAHGALGWRLIYGAIVIPFFITSFLSIIIVTL